MLRPLHVSELASRDLCALLLEQDVLSNPDVLPGLSVELRHWAPPEGFSRSLSLRGSDMDYRRLIGKQCEKRSDSRKLIINGYFTRNHYFAIMASTVVIQTLLSRACGLSHPLSFPSPMARKKIDRTQARACKARRSRRIRRSSRARSRRSSRPNLPTAASARPNRLLKTCTTRRISGRS